MAINEDFDSGLGNYVLLGPFGVPADNGQWVGTVGNISAGCVQLFYSNGAVNDGSLINGGSLNPTGNTHTIVSGDSLYLNYKLITGNLASTFTLVVTLRQIGGSLITERLIAPSNYNWTQYSFSLGASVGLTVGNITIGILQDTPNTASMYVDSIKIGNTPPPFSSSGEEIISAGAKLYYGRNGFQANKALQI